MKKLTLPFRVKRTILACGADLKGAFALAKGNIAYLFEGFGDLADLDNFMRYERAVREAEKRLKIKPQVIVCDLHPGYLSTQFAENSKNRDTSHFSGRTIVRKKGCVPIFHVQHHEAHIASAIIDNGIKGDMLGAAFDGTGYGWDGNIWGGEFFTGNAKRFNRVAHLEYVKMPGGDMCIRQPWRMAASYLYSTFGYVKKYDGKKWLTLKQVMDKDINSPLTSSMGRLFDAVGSLVLNKERSGFEAELPIELEKAADKNENRHYRLHHRSGGTIIDMAGTIKGILSDMESEVSIPTISAKFHNTIAVMILEAAKRFSVKKIVLSGGVFQNKFLVRKARELLEGGGFKVYTHSAIETNDSGIPIGQIAIANARYFPPSHSPERDGMLRRMSR